MNAKEYAEIRRRLNPDRNNVTRMRGAYVSQKNEIMTTFDYPFISLAKEESEKYLAFFRRVLTGNAGRSLLSVRFRPDQLTGSSQHAALMELRASALRSDEAVGRFFGSVASQMHLETDYAILLLHDVYDVPVKISADDPTEKESEDIFSYILCCICPVKPGKEALSWFPPDNSFRVRDRDMILNPPTAGFMFPAFNDRAADISELSFYTHDPDELFEDLLKNVFDAAPFKSVTEQKETFAEVLSESLGESLSYEVAQTVNREMVNRLDEAKLDKEAELPVITCRELTETLKTAGVQEEKLAAFTEKFNSTFGEHNAVNIAGIAETKKMEITTPAVRILVEPHLADTVETRSIDGFRYVMIRADDGVTVNGIPVSIESDIL